MDHGNMYYMGLIAGMAINTLLIMAAAGVIILAGLVVFLGSTTLSYWLCKLYMRLKCRIEVTGIEKIPDYKNTLLLCPHFSILDPLILSRALQTPICLITNRRFYGQKWFKAICRVIGAVDMSPIDPPEKMDRVIERISRAMKQGSLICLHVEGIPGSEGIFPKFMDAFRSLPASRNFQIVPVYPGGAWLTRFGRFYGKSQEPPPFKAPYKISLHVGDALPVDAGLYDLRQRLEELSCNYFNGLKLKRHPLTNYFIRVARRHWARPCISDSTGRKLTYGQTLTAAFALKEHLQSRTYGQNKIGIMLPPSVGGVLANLSVMLLGKIGVNLSYVVSPQVREESIEQCGIKTVITSLNFLKKLESFEPPKGSIFLEDIAAEVTPKDKLGTYLKTRFLPYHRLGLPMIYSADETATIIFSSGSSGQPKGIILTHHNIISHMESVRMLVELGPKDNICGVLPFFHAFGYTVTFWLPLLIGASAVYVPNPLDGVRVGQCCHKHKSTLLVATPTFLTQYIRKTKPADFASLRLIVAGAEKLKKQVADTFAGQFGIRPLEGYGATELSPVISLNLDYYGKKDDSVQLTTRSEDTVGRLIPGMTARIVDIETQQPLPPGQVGLLQVKGHNLMQGYLDMPEQTAEVIKDGYYNTGDVARMDEDGFITITDRLSRFSKVGGEMVPHIAIENLIQNFLNTDEQVVVVTGVPQPTRGEELVVLYLEQAGPAERLYEMVSASDIPNMWKPKRGNYIKIDAIPMLGSGKMDVLRLRDMAIAARKNPENRPADTTHKYSPSTT
ncbi:MAG: AMP-binding protein [Sedimentisphaerales bacterium]|nr:AMP-binding protein [Sedimentisphaerales bacterium]